MVIILNWQFIGLCSDPYAVILAILPLFWNMKSVILNLEIVDLDDTLLSRITYCQ